MNRLFLLLFIFFLTACSTTTDKQLEKDYSVSNQAILDLARSSYLKGCVDAKIDETKKITKGVIFRKCVEKAKIHQKTISEIITDK